jgi:hypothetical protein
MTQNSSMTIQRSWLVENHLMLITMPEILTTAALQANDAELCDLLDASPSSFVHILTDAQALRVYPTLADYMAMRAVKHQHIGWSLTVGAGKQPLLRFFLTTVMSAARGRYRDFDSMAEALAFARTIDPSLVNMPVDA